jgi:arylsulfatase A-like enzyme
MRGFKQDTYIEYDRKKSYYTPSPPVFAKLLPRVKKNLKSGKSAFVFSHLADPHAPYDQGKVKKGPAFGRYLSEVELVDSQLSRLLEVLDDSAKKDSILLIVSADHGEAFGEHNSQTHGTTMYDESLHVPLIFWRPSGQPRTVDDLVSLVDLGPTILDLFGVKTPGHYMGQSLAPYLAGNSPELTRPVVAETRLMRAMVTPERIKLIVDTRSGRTELYDLAKDPGETKNLADDESLLGAPAKAMDAFFEVHTLTKDGYAPPFVK